MRFGEQGLGFGVWSLVVLLYFVNTCVKHNRQITLMFLESYKYSVMQLTCGRRGCECGAFRCELGTKQPVKTRLRPGLEPFPMPLETIEFVPPPLASGIREHAQLQSKLTIKPDFIRTSICEKYSGPMKITTHLEQISVCKKASGINWSNEWTYRVFFINTRRD